MLTAIECANDADAAQTLGYDEIEAVDARLHDLEQRHRSAHDEHEDGHDRHNDNQDRRQAGIPAERTG